MGLIAHSSYAVELTTPKAFWDLANQFIFIKKQLLMHLVEESEKPQLLAVAAFPRSHESASDYWCTYV